MDILAVDSNNRIYNIEIQRSDRGADAKRARYNSSLIDANITEAGDKYDALTETYVIFISYCPCTDCTLRSCLCKII